MTLDFSHLINNFKFANFHSIKLNPIIITNFSLYYQHHYYVPILYLLVLKTIKSLN